MKSSPFADWRSDKDPMPSPIPQLHVDDSACPDHLKSSIRAHCLQQYQKAMQLMEHAVADVALEYVSRELPTSPFKDKFRKDKLQANKPGVLQSDDETGVLLDFANVYSQRYLDLYEAYIAWEMDKKTPMLPVTAGQMKLDGFTSDDLILIKDDCLRYSEITDNIKTILAGNTLHYEKLISVMVGLNKEISLNEFCTDTNKRNNFLAPLHLNSAIGDLLKVEFDKYQLLPHKTMMDTAHLLMHDFRHLAYTDIAMQLYYVGIMEPVPNAKEDERLLMEIRHRICGDMSVHQNSPGTLGGNPQAYLNMLKKGEPGNPAAEFREKMYFVYMSNHFANAIIRDQQRIDFINQWLNTHKRGWQLDQNFIDEMHNRGTRKYIPPVFRYGANAALNTQLRELRSHEEVAAFYKENPNISLRDVMEGLVSINDYYKLKLSDRELFNQIGELKWNANDINRTLQPLNFGTGAALFKLYESVSPSMTDPAQNYINTINALSIPTSAGISGTLDQSTTMAGLVGLGVHADFGKRNLELETIKLAYLAFMLPGRDHSIHEILQSSTTFGLDYVPGPGFQQYLYPPDTVYILDKVKEQMRLRESDFPDYYLSSEYVEVALPKFNSVSQAPSLTTATATQTPTEPNYYIGIPLAGTPLGDKIKALQNENKNIEWINTSNLHITIGWIDNKISQDQKQIIANKLSPLFSKYSNLIFDFNNIEMWNNKEDIIITLKEGNNNLVALRQEIKDELFKMGVNFNFDNTPHIQIGYIPTHVSAPDREATITEMKTPLDLSSDVAFEFEKGAIMHFDSNKNKVITDFNLGFMSYAQKVERTKHTAENEIDSSRQQRKRNNLLLQKAAQSGQQQEKDPPVVSGSRRPKHPGK